MAADSIVPDLIPLAAAAVALGYAQGSASVLLSRGSFPVTVQKQGRHNMVVRADVEAEMRRRPHLTRAQFAAVVKAHDAAGAGGPVPPSQSEDPAVQLLSSRLWISTAEVARLLSTVPAVVTARHSAGKLPFALETDPASKQEGRRAASLDVAVYLASQEPFWPTASAFAAVPSLSLAEVKQALRDESPAGADDPATQAFLASRETITLADYALMLGVPQDTLKRRVQRGKVETVDEPAATGTTRKLKRIRSDYAAAELRKPHQAR